MWLMLNDAFLSFVSKDCAEDELMVRARRKGDIERIFPGAAVTRYTKSDYLYRAPVKKVDVKDALVGEIDRIVYNNFKNSVRDNALHGAYNRVWGVMAGLQEVRPYSGNAPAMDFGGAWLDAPKPKPAHIAKGLTSFATVAKVKTKRSTKKK